MFTDEHLVYVLYCVVYDMKTREKSVITCINIREYLICNVGTELGIIKCQSKESLITINVYKISYCK